MELIAEVSNAWKILNKGVEIKIKELIMRSNGEYIRVMTKLVQALRNAFLGSCLSIRISLQMFKFKFDLTNNYYVKLLICPINSTKKLLLIKGRTLENSKFVPTTNL